MRKLLPALISLSLALASAQAAAQDMQKDVVQVSIERKDLRDALNEWAQQTNYQLITDIKGTFAAPKVAGRLTPQEALERLIAGAPLSYRVVGPRVVAVREKPAVVPAALKLGESATDPLPSSGLANGLGDAHGGGAIRVAQASTSGDSAAKAPSTAAQEISIEEIIVTGTMISGLRNATVPLNTYDRSAIERTGRTTTQAFMETLPQNFKGGDIAASADGILAAGGRQNIENASGVNLRGLGTSSTLILLNGSRVAPAAYGSAVDVSMIPLNAVERIDVLTDGASAIYGTDAVGGVVNFVLRKDYDGQETSLNYGTVTDGDYSQTSVAQMIGRAWDGGGALLSLHYQDDDSLSSADRSITQNVPRPTDIFPENEKYAGLFSGHQDLSENVAITADVLYNHDRGFRNYTTEDIGTEALTNETEFLSAHVGLNWNLSRTWRLEANGLYSDNRTDWSKEFADPASIPLAFVNGEIVSYVNGTPILQNDYSLDEGSIKADGDLFALSGGSAKLAVGGAYRREDFSSFVPYQSRDRTFDRNVTSAFAELYLPVFGSGNARPFLHRLDFSAAVRYDDYSDFGDTTNPKFGFYWSPIEQFGLRASYGTSFRAPSSLEQITAEAGRTAFSFGGYAQPGGGTGPVLIVSSPKNLQPEESRNLSVGFDFMPASVAGLKMSANFYRIEYENRLITAPFDAEELIKPEVYGNLVTPFADQAAVDAYVASLLSQGYQFFDATGTGTAGIRFAVPAGQINASHVVTNGWDLLTTYSFDVGASKFNVGLNATRINKIDTGFCSSCEATDLVNKFGQPLRTRARANIGWLYDQWQLDTGVNYSAAYTNTAVSPSQDIGSFTTVDFSARYRPALIRGLDVSLSVLNVADRDPPKVAGVFNDVGFDVQNASVLGRFVSLQLRQSW